MLKALVIKELRESAGVIAVALLGLLYALASLTGFQILPWQFASIYNNYPFVSDSLGFYLWLCVGGLAIGLGLKQTAWELGHSTYFFLLHRPVSRLRVFSCKLAVGLVCVLLASGLLILLYAWWAAAPGHIAAPFYWSMTRPAWCNWVALPLVYVGAFLSGIRPGRWFGSRLVPLVAALALALLAANLPWVWLALGTSLLGIALGLVAIFYYVRQRDF